MGAAVSFVGKHVAVTGGSEGIGLALARECLQESATVTLLARNEDKLKIAKHQLMVLPALHLCHTCGTCCKFLVLHMSILCKKTLVRDACSAARHTCRSCRSSP